MAVNQSPIFSTGEPLHYGDYGFDPHVDYFQKILEEARKRTTTTSFRSRDRDRDFHHLKLQKPISKDAAGKKKKRTRLRWWWWWKGSTALRFWKWARTTRGAKEERSNPKGRSGPLYLTESHVGPRTQCRRRSGAGSFRTSALVAAEVGMVETPYLNLRDVGASSSAAAPPPAPGPPSTPLYFVT